MIESIRHGAAAAVGALLAIPTEIRALAENLEAGVLQIERAADALERRNRFIDLERQMGLLGRDKMRRDERDRGAESEKELEIMQGGEAPDDTWPDVVIYKRSEEEREELQRAIDEREEIVDEIRDELGLETPRERVR
jgi:hypothetical protein